jgi:hypothetical protein
MKESKCDNTKFDFLEKHEFVPPDKEKEKSKDQSDSIKINETTPKKGIAIYCLELKKEEESHALNKITLYYSNSISGICNFIEVTSEDDIEQRRFILLNFRGIYNFEFDSYFEYFNLNEKFEYPQCIRRELDNWYKDSDIDCMNRLLTCIYDKYFLVTRYKNDVQSLEGKKL